MAGRSIKHISVRIPRGMDRWLRIEAAKRDISKSALIRDILSERTDPGEVIDVKDYSVRSTTNERNRLRR